MGRITVLPTDLANQIAAGEVVERPASVVKELIENAIDAGARRIQVSIELGGKRLVRVEDDGEGMSPEDARLSIDRHATSKIRRADDLAAITTLGLSRDDASRFLDVYVAKGIFPRDPFVSLDVEGVGQLITVAVERGRVTRPGIKLGICGEHGGDPASIAFCEKVGLDYVSASPYRVPIARLAAAQAALRSD